MKFLKNLFRSAAPPPIPAQEVAGGGCFPKRADWCGFLWITFCSSVLAEFQTCSLSGRR